ncbi:unnamed protein product [Closterium sp. NIES-65]|nr:unnamed protein product [Closterium sp. NIES-65]
MSSRVHEKTDDGSITFDQGHSFDVKDEKSAEVRVAVAGKTAMGMRKVLGSIKPLRVCDLLETDPDRTLEPEWYEIVAKEGKKSSEGKQHPNAPLPPPPAFPPALYFLPPLVLPLLFLPPLLPCAATRWQREPPSTAVFFSRLKPSPLLPTSPPPTGAAARGGSAGAATAAHQAYRMRCAAARGGSAGAATAAHQAVYRVPDDLSPWLPKGTDHELIAIGSQECEYQPRPGYATCMEDWVAAIKAHFAPHYKMVKGTTRGQMRLVVLVLETSQKAITDVTATSEATGIGHVIANKGAVSVSLKFWDTSFCFVNSHLAAHEGHCMTRNDNYREVMRNMHPGLSSIDLLSQFHSTIFHQTYLSLSPLPNLSIPFTELQREIREGRSFYKFCEAPIAFAPTFKVLRDELQQYNPKRLPAWCDRVLWRSLPGCKLTCTRYTSAPTILTGDHKPVLAEFDITTYALPVTMDPSEDAVQLLQLSKGHSDKDDMRWHLHILELRGHNLLPADANGLSDPYIRFVGPNLFKSFQTKKCYKTLNPVWGADDVPAIVLEHQSLHYYEKDYLLAAVFDYDKTNKDDPIGYAAIPLADLVKATWEQSSQPVSFRVEVTYKGLPAGELEGSFRLFWAVNKLSEGKCAQM